MKDFYTVSQYAKITGKDPGNIRRMLIQGKIEGEKVGSQWLIPQGTDYPEDKRVKHGDYRNWRQRVKINGKHPYMLKKLSEMCDVFEKIYGCDIAEVILYGSYARGQESDESDLDMALILKNEPTEEQTDRMTDVIVDYQLDIGKTLSVITVNQRELSEWKTILPFYKNMCKEGIVIWKHI